MVHKRSRILQFINPLFQPFDIFLLLFLSHLFDKHLSIFLLARIHLNMALFLENGFDLLGLSLLAAACLWRALMVALALGQLALAQTL